MSVKKIASRYAQSLLDLAVEQNKLDKIVGDVKGFSEACDNRDLYLMLKSPIINAGKKLNVLQALFSSQADELTMAFLTILTKKGREIYLPEIADEFIARYQAFLKVTKVIITTAKPLESAELEQIKSKLLGSSVTADSLDIETKIDPAIIGGFVLEIGDKLYDASVAHKLDKLKKQFSDN